MDPDPYVGEVLAPLPVRKRRTPEAGSLPGIKRHARNAPTASWSTARVYLLAGSAYLVLGIGIWWHVWSSHPTASATCACGDPALFMWFLEWPAYALTHGHNPFYSTALFQPGGVNLLSNTSVLGIGIPLAPVTLLFGPVASLNVAATLAPPLSALAAFWLARRWVTWAPAAWMAGLLYGFSPLVLNSLAFAHLMTGTLVFPPLILGALDELLVRQSHPPVRVGILAGFLVAVEFFVSTEMVLIIALSALLGILLLLGYAVAGHRQELAARVPAALRGLGAMLAVVVILLGYPSWFALDGPAHLAGSIWPKLQLTGGYSLADFVNGSTTTGDPATVLGGYFGPIMTSSAFVGFGLFAVLAAGLAIWRRDRRLWFFGALAVATGALALGVDGRYWVPWRLLVHLPLFENVTERRFMAISYLALSMMFAIVIDRARSLDRVHGLHASTRRGALTSWAAVAVAIGAGIVPMAAAIAPTVPLATQSVNLPAWFVRAGPRLPSGSVVLAYPAPFSGSQATLAWQASDKLHFAMASGGGPQGSARRAGAERAGFEALAGLSIGFAPLPAGTPAELSAVRRAIAGWEVTTVVIPNLPRSLPPIVRGNDPQYAAGFMTAALGRLPVYRDHAWVWTGANRTVPVYRVPAGTVGRCTELVEKGRFTPLGAPACVAAASR